MKEVGSGADILGDHTVCAVSIRMAGYPGYKLQSIVLQIKP